MRKINISLASALFLFAISCDRPECNNTNVIFDTNPPESNAYKAELARQLPKYDGLTYWFDRYEEKNSEKLMHVFVQDDSLCAKAVITVTEPDKKLDGIIRAKGGGYHGAELDGLEFAIIQEAGETLFIYKNLDRILD